MMKKIQKTAKKFIKQLNGVVTFDTVADYLQKQGYTVIYYSSPECQPLVEEYNLSEYRNSVNAFTYTSDSVNLVFINDNMSLNNMLRSILHEAGHVYYGHLLSNPFAKDNRQDELEAETFAYAVLNYKKSNVYKFVVAGALGVVVSSLIFLRTKN